MNKLILSRLNILQKNTKLTTNKSNKELQFNYNRRNKYSKWTPLITEDHSLKEHLFIIPERRGEGDPWCSRSGANWRRRWSRAGWKQFMSSLFWLIGSFLLRALPPSRHHSLMFFWESPESFYYNFDDLCWCCLCVFIKCFIYNTDNIISLVLIVYFIIY